MKKINRIRSRKVTRLLLELSKCFIICLILKFFLVHNCFSQYIDSIRRENVGLILNGESEIYDIITQNSKVIFATKKGLYECDSVFKSLKPINTQISGIFNVKIHPQTKQLWAINQRSLYNLSNKKHFDFISMNLVSADGKEELKNFLIDKGEIWVSTLHSIFILDTLKGLHHVRTLSFTGDGLNPKISQKTDKVNTIFCDESHRKWIISNRGVVALENDDNGGIRKTVLPESLIKFNYNFIDIVQLRDRYEFYLVTQSGDIYFLRLRGGDLIESFSKFFNSVQKDIRKIFFDSQENYIWLLSDKVVRIPVIKTFEEDSLKIFSHESEPAFKSEQAHSIASNNKGGIIIGTHGSGVYTFYHSKKKYPIYSDRIEVNLVPVNLNNNARENSSQSKTKIVMPSNFLRKEWIVDNFEEDKSENYAEKMDRVLKEIKGIIGNKKILDYHLKIEGYASKTPTGNIYNGVSFRRIGFIKELLMKRCKIPNENIKTKDYEDKDLIDKENPYSGRNRRVKVLIEYFYGN